jgi:hypothetical protein
MKKQHFILLVSALLAVTSANAQLGGLLKKKKTDAPAQETTTENKSETPAAGSTSVPAADASKPNKDNRVVWDLKFEGAIEWFSLSPTGNLIVSSRGSLYGVEGGTGKVLWKNDKFGGVDKENFTVVAGSPYGAMVSGGMLNRQHTIINTETGAVVADTRDMGLKMVSKRYPLPNENGFVMAAYEDGKTTVFMVDATQSKIVWKVKDLFAKNNEVLLTRPLPLGNGDFLVATDKNIYKMNVRQGAVVYTIPFKTPTEPLKSEVKDEEGMTESTKADEKKGPGLLGSLGKVGNTGLLGNAGRLGGAASDAKTSASGFGNIKVLANQAAMEVSGKFFKLDESGRVYYFNNKYFVGLDAATGKFLYEPFKFDDEIASFIPDEKGFVFATDEKKSEMYSIDPATGKNRWPKAVELKGRIVRISLNDGKIAVASAKESGKNYVNIVDAATGEEVNKKDMKVSGQVLSVVMAKRGLIYTTTTETNIQDPVSGNDVMSKSLKYKTGGATVRKDGKYYLVNDEEISEIDEATGEVRSFATVKFNDGEKPSRLELRKDGLMVSAAQNMTLLGWDGKEKYHRFYKAPGSSIAGKILAGAAMAISVSQSAAQGYAAGSSGFGTAAYSQHMESADRWGSVGASAASAFSKRFNMSAQSNNYQVILTKLDDGSEDGVGLIRVNKDSGLPEAKVVIGDKVPDYLFDEIENTVYYKDRNNKIVAFRF